VRILGTIAQALQWCPSKSLDAILAEVGMPLRTYHRWTNRARQGQLADHIVTPQRSAIRPTPVEEQCVRSFAETHWGLGYKRLAYSLMLENQAFLYPWMVHAILAEASLLGRRQPAPELLHRPPEASHPDQRWHTDLMMWYFDAQWYWLLDVLDAYSRYLVHCEVLITATAQDIVYAEQRAIETLLERARRAGEPEIVHDGGPQFIGRE
jgi:transposase InsO family protein